MSGLLRRLTRRRPATADETGSPAPESSEPAGATADTPAEPGGGQPVAAPSEEATQVLRQTGEQPAAEPGAGVQRAAGGEQPIAADEQPTGADTAQTVPVRDLPAGVDPSEYSDVPAASAPRGKLRRRLRYLRRVRDLLLRDLGGFTFEIHRTAGGTPTESHRKLVESKLSRIEALDAEVRALEGRVGEPHEAALLHEPGIGGTCPECGELHSSDAHYCARCGAPLDAKARARREAAVAAAVQETTAAQPGAEAAPASVLWAAGPRPGGAAPEPEPDEQPSEVTSRWLAGARRAKSSAAAPLVVGPTPDAAAEPAREASGGEPATAGDDAAVGAEKPVPAKPAPDESAARPDEGATDAGASDEGATDAGASDEDATDAGANDEDATDAGASDEGAADKSPAGEAAADKGPADEGATDAGAPDEHAADEAAADKGPADKRAPHEGAGDAPDFAPAPNGRRTDDVPAPDPLPSRPERGA